MADDTSYDNKDVKAAKSAASKGNKGPKEKTLVHKQRKLLRPPYSLTSVTPDTTNITNVDSVPAAPWIKPDEHDDIIELKKQYLQQQGADKKTATGPLGQIYVDKDDLLALQRKKDDETYLRELSMAQLLIADDPALRQISAEKAYKIYPELQTVPEEAHKKYVGMQASLRTILRDGIIRGKDDNQLILSILDPAFVMPLFPLYDMDGKILEKVYNISGMDKYADTAISGVKLKNKPGSSTGEKIVDSDYVKINIFYTATPKADSDEAKRLRRRGIFNPVRYAPVDSTIVNSGYDEPTRKRNLLTKLLIMKRLYPQLKNAKFDTLMQLYNENFKASKSALGPITEDPFNNGLT